MHFDDRGALFVWVGLAALLHAGIDVGDHHARANLLDPDVVAQVGLGWGRQTQDTCGEPAGDDACKSELPHSGAFYFLSSIAPVWNAPDRFHDRRFGGGPHGAILPILRRRAGGDFDECCVQESGLRVGGNYELDELARREAFAHQYTHEARDVLSWAGSRLT